MTSHQYLTGKVDNYIPVRLTPKSKAKLRTRVNKNITISEYVANFLTTDKFALNYKIATTISIVKILTLTLLETFYCCFQSAYFTFAM